MVTVEMRTPKPTVAGAGALLACLVIAACPARAEDMTHRLGIQPLVGHVTVTNDSFLSHCHDSFLAGGRSAGLRLNMGITRWFSITFSVQPALWSVRPGHFIDTRKSPAEIPICDTLGAEPQGLPISGYQRIVVTSLAQKASFKVQDNANLYLLLGEGIYHREVGLSWRQDGEEINETITDRYTGLAIAFGMDLHLNRSVSLHFELAAHLLSDSYGAGAVLFAPNAGLTYWVHLGRPGRP